MSLQLPANLSVLFEHVRAAYPHEGCGLIFQEAEGLFTQVPMENVYDKYHQRDPERFPRTSRTAYKLDELHVYQLLEAAEARQAKLAAIVHSHCDVGAYFSQEDRDMAAPNGQPLWPGVVYLVIAVDQRQITEAKAYAWENNDFREFRVPQG